MDLKLKWLSIDNYFSCCRALFGGGSPGINDVSAAFIVLSIGMILKDTASAITQMQIKISNPKI